MYANKEEMEPYFAEFQKQNWTSKKQPTKIYGEVHKDLIQLSKGNVTVRSHGREVRENQHGMVEVKHNEKLKGNDNWDEEEAGVVHQDEKAGGRQKDEEAGAGQEDAGADEDLMGGDGSEEVVQRRGTRKSHYINPPPVPAPENRRLIKPIGDGQWEDVTWDGIYHRVG
ncbi:hypothetical protein U9M48_002359 [Paspalum notatum var. saurae]|uniref:Uncharacterized protein n=1 Tax=Paspalum notatum var. saurae TaxID=547442 RepID=A0AAQ3SHE3_PASNO